MIIGCPKEIKTREYRVGLVPGGVAALTARGHTVLMEKGAGVGSGIRDDDYEAAGAKIVDKASEVWARAEMIVKVKEPVASEYALMKEGQDRKSTRLNSSHSQISYAVFCLKKKKKRNSTTHHDQPS